MFLNNNNHNKNIYTKKRFYIFGKLINMKKIYIYGYKLKILFIIIIYKGA